MMKNNIFKFIETSDNFQKGVGVSANLQNSLNEIFDTILQSHYFKLERIISFGQASPQDFWYDQDWNEWVLLLQGSAELLFDNDEIITLLPGDYIDIPSHRRHRVISTDKMIPTIWLAFHYT